VLSPQTAARLLGTTSTIPVFDASEYVSLDLEQTLVSAVTSSRSPTNLRCLRITWTTPQIPFADGICDFLKGHPASMTQDVRHCFMKLQCCLSKCYAYCS
jgi:hypothetical protein